MPMMKTARELEALGGVEGDQGDGVGLLVVLVDVGDEGDVFEERSEGVLRLELVVLGGDGAELLDVLPALLAVVVGEDVRPCSRCDR